MPQIQIQMERKRDTQKKAFVVAAICIYIFAFSLAFVTPVSGAFSSVIITDVNPTEFHPGETKEVVLTVKNNGGRDARDVRLAFQVQDKGSVSLVGPTVAQINTLNSWCEKEVKITVHVTEGTPNGVYSIPISCKWYEYSSVPGKGFAPMYTFVGGSLEPVYEKSAQLGISFNVKGDVRISIGDTSTDPREVRPGDVDVKIKVPIYNIGEVDAKDVKAMIICNNGFSPSRSESDRACIPSLPSNSYSSVEFHIDVADDIEAEAPHSIPLKVYYTDMENIKYGKYGLKEKHINVWVEREPELEIVSHYTEPVNISAGDHVILRVRVQNVGSEDAESVSIRVTGEADVPFDFAVKSNHVGNLEVNETGDAILEFDVDKEAPKKIYQQGLEIRCVGDRDLGDDKVYTFNKEIRLEVTSSSSGSSSVPGFEALFSFLVLILVFFFIELRKKEKER